jgi:penicillin-binding protein 1A
MEPFLVKVLATALTLSQVLTTPNALKTHFDRDSDQQQVAQILHAGCVHTLKNFGLEDVHIDALISVAMRDPQAIGVAKGFHGINFAGLHAAYRQFCKEPPVGGPAIDLGAVIEYYNKTTAKLPDLGRFQQLTLSEMSKAKGFAKAFQGKHRRLWIPLADIPAHVRNAFIAAEDKRFFRHKGIDERGMLRAFIHNLAHFGRPQGGSTITQQVAKNLLVGDDLTYRRKIREMIMASRIEQMLSKNDILELYLNSIYLGRNAWGIELAARSYFGKPATQLSVEEGALLAGLAKGPNYFNPDRHPMRAQRRLAYVLGRMRADGMLAAAGPAHGLPTLPMLEPVRTAAPRNRLPLRRSGRSARPRR